VKEVTGVASSAFAPATLAGRGVIELIRADARIFPARAELYCLGAPQDLATLGRLAVSPCATLRKELDANSAEPLITVLTAPFWAGAIKG
jgi:hypothetical protein